MERMVTTKLTRIVTIETLNWNVKVKIKITYFPYRMARLHFDKRSNFYKILFLTFLTRHYFAPKFNLCSEFEQKWIRGEDNEQWTEHTIYCQKTDTFPWIFWTQSYVFSNLDIERFDDNWGNFAREWQCHGPITRLYSNIRPKNCQPNAIGLERNFHQRFLGIDESSEFEFRHMEFRSSTSLKCESNFFSARQ